MESWIFEYQKSWQSLLGFYSKSTKSFAHKCHKAHARILIAKLFIIATTIKIVTKKIVLHLLNGISSRSKKEWTIAIHTKINLKNAMLSEKNSRKTALSVITFLFF